MNIEFIEIQIPQEKSFVCEMILRSLPKWFAIESAITDYITKVQPLQTLAASLNDEIIGFLSIEKHDKTIAEIYVMGVLAQYHRQKVGKKMLELAETKLRNEGFKSLQVKTLAESAESFEYAITRKFYVNQGFNPKKEIHGLWGDDNPCLLMEKSL